MFEGTAGCRRRSKKLVFPWATSRRGHCWMKKCRDFAMKKGDFTNKMVIEASKQVILPSKLEQMFRNPNGDFTTCFLLCVPY
jgi:hypothetical protein